MTQSTPGADRSRPQIGDTIVRTHRIVRIEWGMRSGQPHAVVLAVNEMPATHRCAVWYYDPLAAPEVAYYDGAYGYGDEVTAYAACQENFDLRSSALRT